MTEADRIIALILGRIGIHEAFIRECIDHNIEPSSAVLSALAELRAVMREINRHD